MGAQPPLPMMSERSQRSRGLGSNMRLTPMSDTPLASRNKVGQITEEMKKERAKNALQQTLKDKQAALQVQEEKLKKQKNRAMKQKGKKKVTALKKEITDIEAQL